MKLKDIKDVLTFASFRPEPDDSSATWTRRFPRKKTLLLGAGRSSLTWAGLERGRFSGGGYLDGDLKELATQMAEEWKGMTDDGWCAVSLSSRYVISLETNLSRRKGTEDQIRTNPKAALGAKAERGKRYAVKHNPESNTSVLLALDEDMIRRVETTMRDVGLRVGRITCGPYVMMCDLIDQVAEARQSRAGSQADADLGTLVLVVCCQGSVCALTQREDQWLELRSRTDIYEEGNLEPVLGIVMPLIENAGAGAHVLFMGDQSGSDFPQMLQAKAPHLRVSDLTAENQLWKLLSDH